MDKLMNQQNLRTSEWIREMMDVRMKDLMNLSAKILKINIQFGAELKQK